MGYNRKIPTLLDFASKEELTLLLVKERVKCRRRNRGDKKHHLDRECDINTLSMRKMLSLMMPPRYSWVTPSKRNRLENDALDQSKNAEKALLLTIKRDRKRLTAERRFRYLEEMDAFIIQIKQRLASATLSFESPQLRPILKSVDIEPDGSKTVTCRPLSIYSHLEDKIILALTSRFTRFFDKYLHENILSYRKARFFHGKEHHVTDFNDGIQLIDEFRKAHIGEDIYESDCDIKKFYDIIPHSTVHKCFKQFLDRSPLDEDAKGQVMRVIDAYLSSYNFFTNAWQKAEAFPAVYAKVRRRLHDQEGQNKYQLGWVDEIMNMPEDERRQRGVPQGGALSLVVANVVLNEVDRVIVDENDCNRLFIRYCDDMILLHTCRDTCERMMRSYVDSLNKHGLYYHAFEHVADAKETDNPTKTTGKFWSIKSHYPFL